MEDILSKYEHERNKRLAQRPEGLAQYKGMEETKAEITYIDDPWIPNGTQINHPVADNGHVKYLIAGAGFGGLLIAHGLLEKGAKPQDILIVDPAGGFGGTWYWNRFPGLMCDIESYIYLPLLEETGYMPTRKYASGDEIRRYSELAAAKFGLTDRAMFQSSAKSFKWDGDHWVCEILERPKGGKEKLTTIHANFTTICSGPFPGPKIPDFANDFQGHMFHTLRWDYSYTGGTPTDPAMTGLESKRVAFIGTGATGIQCVPALAKHAGELYVFQRTPSAVAGRGQRDTDPSEWKEKIANKPGWWLDRNVNFHSCVQNAEPKPDVDLVNDDFSSMPSYASVFGGPADVTSENVGEWVKKMHALDYPRSEKVRLRAEEIVKDPSTAKKLQAWYPGWCKRPCFHDDYLPAFNQRNVHLIDDGEGAGVTGVTKTGVLAAGKEWPVDVIIWGTGYASPLTGTHASRAGIEIIGKNGVTMDEVAAKGPLETLHGVISPGFPNHFYVGLGQSGVGPNQTHRLAVLAKHMAHIISEAERKAGPGKKAVVEPAPEAVEEWAQKVASLALVNAPMMGCTPSYFNLEGEVDKLPPEVQGHMARYGAWGRGMNDFQRVMSEYEANGNLQGFLVAAA